MHSGSRASRSRRAASNGWAAIGISAGRIPQRMARRGDPAQGGKNGAGQSAPPERSCKMTGNDVFAAAAAYLSQSTADSEDLAPFVPLWLNVLLAECLPYENMLRARQGMEPLAEAPRLAQGAMDTDIPYREVILRTGAAVRPCERVLARRRQRLPHAGLPREIHQRAGRIAAGDAGADRGRLRPGRVLIKRAGRGRTREAPEPQEAGRREAGCRRDTGAFFPFPQGRTSIWQSVTKWAPRRGKPPNRRDGRNHGVSKFPPALQGRASTRQSAPLYAAGCSGESQWP